MAAFSTEVAAEGLVHARVTAKTYLNGHVVRQADGTIAMRVLLALQNSGTGGWSEITTDA